MSDVFKHLHTVGLNPLAVQLLAESMLKSPHVAQAVGKPISFEFPVQRSDCPGYIGVRISIEPIPTQSDAQIAAENIHQEDFGRPMPKGAST